MKKTNLKLLKQIAKEFLFENSAQINLPVDDGMYANNSRMTMHDRPVSKANSSEIVDGDGLDIIIPSEVIPNQSLINVNIDVSDKSFVPENKDELSSAVAVLFKDTGMNDLSKEKIEKAWKLFKKIMDND